MWSVLQGFRVRDAIDIVVVAVVLYRVFVMFKETRAVQMLLGLAGLMIASYVARRFELFSTSWLLDNLWSFWVLALIVLFQPELRRTLAQAGRSRLLQRVFGENAAAQHQIVEEAGRAVEALAVKRIGALVALERTGGLGAYAELGVPMDAAVSAELLGSIFQPGSPLHDGAAIIQGGRISAAGCFLPLSRNLQLARTLGTRHRAALGLSEETDAVVIIVSEETGRVSLAVEGRIEGALDGTQLRARLAELLEVPRGQPARSRSLLASVWRVREKV
jgi:diadenylate cyclase